MKRGRATALVVLLAVIAFVAFLALRPREPAYKGKPLHIWLREMECRPGWGESVQAIQAREAVASMGPIAVPYLVKIAQRQSSGVNLRYRKFFYEHRSRWPRVVASFLPIPLTYPYQMQMNAVGALAQIGEPKEIVLQELIRALHHEYSPIREVAAVALAKLGDQAVPALRQSLRDNAPGVRLAAADALWKTLHDAAEPLPVLVQLLGDVTNRYEFRWRSAQVLGEMGPRAQSAVPALIEALKDPENFVRYCAARSLGEIGTDTARAVPDLIWSLDENHLAPSTRSADFGGDWQVCLAAADTLGHIRAPAETVVRALIATLDSAHAEVTVSSCRALARFGREAEQAVPALLRLTRHSDSTINTAAIHALQQIDPDAATKARVK